MKTIVATVNEGAWTEESFDDGSIKVTYYTSGDQVYSLNHKLHREDGPAIDYSASSGGQYWYLDGVEYFPKNNEEWLRWIKMKALL